MRAVLLVVAVALTSACTTVHSTTTTEADPAALASATFWLGVFWVTVAAGLAIVLTAWAIAYAISERAKYSDRHERGRE